MNEKDTILEQYQLIRNRWDSEDNLLLSRTGVFLTVNSIFFAASQIQKNPDSTFMIGLMVFSLIISFLWLTISWHSFNIIAQLYREAIGFCPEEIKCIYSIDPVFVYPTTVFGKILHSVVIVTWIVYLAWYIRDIGLWAVLTFLLLMIGLSTFIVYAEKHTRRLKSAEQGA